MELESPPVLEQLLESVDEAEQLRPGLRRLMGFEGRSAPITAPDRSQQIEALIVRDLREKRRVVGESDSRVTNVLENARLRRVSRDEWLAAEGGDEMWVKGEMMSLAGNTFHDALGDYSRVVSAFMEAIYGRVRDYSLVWAVLRPLMRGIEYDPEPSVLLWENAIHYLLSEDGDCPYCDLYPGAAPS